MKKVLLLFGIAAYCSASAQQKDVFDVNRQIRDMLNKNQNKPNKIIPPVINYYSFNNRCETPGI